MAHWHPLRFHLNGQKEVRYVPTVHQFHIFSNNHNVRRISSWTDRNYKTSDHVYEYIQNHFMLYTFQKFYIALYFIAIFNEYGNTTVRNIYYILVFR